MREQLVLEVLEDFSFLNQDLQITFAFADDVLPEKSQFASAECIAEMIRSGRIDWDVVWLDQLVYQQVARLLDDPDWGQEHLVNFFGNRAVEEAHKPFLFEQNNRCRSTGSVLTGPYIEGFFYLMICNQDVAERIGLSIAEEEMTAGDLLDYARRLDEFNRTAAEPVDLMAVIGNSSSLQRVAYNLFLSCPTEEQAGQAVPALARVFETFEQLGTFACVRSMKENPSWEETIQRFMQDRVLFIPDATWRFNMLAAAYPDNVHKAVPVQMPGFGPQRYCIGDFNPTWAVMANSPARQAGIRLMEFWSRPEIAEKWERYTHTPSGLRGGIYDPEYRNDVWSIYQRRLIRGRTMHPDFYFNSSANPMAARSFPYLFPLIRQEITAAEALLTATKPVQ